MIQIFWVDEYKGQARTYASLLYLKSETENFGYCHHLWVDLFQKFGPVIDTPHLIVNKEKE